LNLCFLQTILNDLEVLFRSEELSKSERSQILSSVNKLTGISKETQPTESMAPVLSDYLFSIRAGKSIDSEIVTKLSTEDFLNELAKTLYERTKLFYRRRILFLLDDYANDWLPSDVANAINQVLFRRSAECTFKIATIPGRQNFSLGRSFDVQPARDYLAINLAPNIVFKNIKSRTAFLQRILDSRLQSVGSLLSSKQLFGSASTFAGLDYSGIDGLTRLCNSDFSSIILICNHMITQSESLEKPITREIQNRVIIDYSKQLVDNLHHGYEWGEYVHGFLGTMMNFIKELNRKPEKNSSESRFIGEKMYGSFVFRNIERLTQESQKKLLWLIRSGVLQEASTLVSAKKRFVFKQLLFPCFRLPIYGFRSFVDLDATVSELLLNRPSEFWRYFSSKLGRPDTTLFQ